MDDTSDSKIGGSGNAADHPFYLHPSDSPSLLLVSKCLNGSNYNSWSRAFTVSLSAKNKTGFIDGKLKAPSIDKKPDDYALWKRCNDMVLSWLWNACEQDITESILYATSSREVWVDLQERFSQSNAPRIFQLQHDIASLPQGQLSVLAYYSKLKSLWDELGSYSDSVCTCGVNGDRNRLMQFLMGLNEGYSAIRGQILLMNPLPSVRQAYSSVAIEEKQREVASSIAIEPAAMAVRGNNRRPANQDSGSSSDSRDADKQP